MPVSEHPMQALAAFLPDGSFEKVVEYIHHFKVHLTISKQRKSVLGDYRHSGWGGNHRISVNGNLNKYEFLITLLHELAHLLTYEQYKNRVEPHGKEWKNHYSTLLSILLIIRSSRRILKERCRNLLSIHLPLQTAKQNCYWCCVNMMQQKKKASCILLMYRRRHF
jgi:hypothetical protein